MSKLPFLPLLAACCWLSVFTCSITARPDSYAAWVADSVIQRGQGNGLDASGKPIVSYEHGELQVGLRQLYELTGNKTYYDYIVQGASNVVYDNGTVHGAYTVAEYTIDPIRVGPTFLYLYKKTKQEKWKIAADIFKSQLDTHPRTAQQQFWHKKRYPYQGWLDGIYMGDVFYAQYTKDFQPSNKTAWADIALQFKLMYQNTIQTPGVANYTGLMYHGYDYSHTTVWANEDRGHSPEVWIRAVGWYTMALVDILEIFPKSEPGYATILNILQTLIPRVRDNADPASGVWWLVMTQPGRAGNYLESSGSAMFVYSMLKAVRKGYVKDKDGSIVAAARKAYGYMTANWVIEKPNGTMDWNNTVRVGSLDVDGSFQYYIGIPIVLNDLKGVAAFLLASLEHERLR